MASWMCVQTRNPYECFVTYRYMSTAFHPFRGETKPCEVHLFPKRIVVIKSPPTLNLFFQSIMDIAIEQSASRQRDTHGCRQGNRAIDRIGLRIAIGSPIQLPGIARRDRP